MGSHQRWVCHGEPLEWCLIAVRMVRLNPVEAGILGDFSKWGEHFHYPGIRFHLVRLPTWRPCRFSERDGAWSKGLHKLLSVQWLSESSIWLLSAMVTTFKFWKCYQETSPVIPICFGWFLRVTLISCVTVIPQEFVQLGPTQLAAEALLKLMEEQEGDIRTRTIGPCFPFRLSSI